MPSPPVDSPASVPPRDLGWLREQIARRALIRDGNGRLRSAGGRRLAWCFDLRTLTLDAEAVRCIADLFWDRWGERWPFQVCGLEMAAVPLVTAIALEGARRGRPAPALVVRKERKAYGLARQLEGTPTGDPVVIVDDVINSAASAEKVRVVLQSESLQAVGLFALVDFGTAAGLDWRGRHGIAVTPLFGLADFGLMQGPAAAAPPRRRFELAWRFDPAEARHLHVAPKSTPLALDGRVIFGCDDGHLVALDAPSGAPAWTFRAAGRSAKGIWSSPISFRGRVFVGAYDGSVYAIEAASGALAWRQPVADWIGASLALDAARARLVVGLEHALPGRHGGVAALDAQDGHVVWETSLPKFQHGTPVLDSARDQVIVGTNDGRVLALRADTGALVWERAVGGPVKGTPALCPELGLVVAGGFDGRLHALAAADGSPRWQWQADDIFYAEPLVRGTRAWAACVDKRLRAVDLATGALLATADLHSALLCEPRWIEGSVFVGSNSGRVFELDPRSLAVRGSLQLPERLASAVVRSTASGLFHVASNAGHLFAFRRTDQTTPRPTPPATARGAARLRHFRYLGCIDDIEAVQREVAAADALWQVGTARQRHVAVQRETESIALRAARRREGVTLNDTLASEPTALAARFPVVMRLVHEICRHLGGLPARVMLVRLRPGGRVYPHVDQGAYYRAHDRLHIDVVSEAGSTLTCADECVAMRPGEVWQFDNGLEHSAANPGRSWRVHVIFDVTRPSN